MAQQHPLIKKGRYIIAGICNCLVAMVTFKNNGPSRFWDKIPNLDHILGIFLESI